MKIVARRLQTVRHYYGLNLSAMCSICSASEAEYESYETGEVDMPDALIEALQHKLKINPLWLKGTERKMLQLPK